MFYSQFILAKKGPLGTIWIAAHLERKLRKNQVADTDIGVSVDSILFPEMPIALRLSSHLLLGVVRIYSRKVNYLFDDCSEALLKVKQAFRSTAVDLPPEESTAPYHSITLPETFDLDDFELPDNENLQGNYVDHHISSKDQITLQDTMEGVVYSTSKFGLDERFGDGEGDVSGLDLDEELLVGKPATAEHATGTSNSVFDHPESVQANASFKYEDNQDALNVPEAMPASDIVNQHIGEYDGDNEPVDYAQAPCTPGLWEEPNLSNIQETSAWDDHHEPENHSLTESAIKENPENASSKEAECLPQEQHHNQYEAHGKSYPHIAETEQTVKENPENASGKEAECLPQEQHHIQYEPHGKSLPHIAETEQMMMGDIGSTPFTESLFAGQVRSTSPIARASAAVIAVSDVPVNVEDLLDRNARDEGPGIQTADDHHENYVKLQGMSEDISQISHNAAGSQENTCHLTTELELNTEPSGKDDIGNLQGQAFLEPKDSMISVQSPHYTMPSSDFPSIRPCVTLLNHSETSGKKLADTPQVPQPSDFPSMHWLETSGREEHHSASGASIYHSETSGKKLADTSQPSDVPSLHWLERSGREELHSASGASIYYSETSGKKLADTPQPSDVPSLHWLDTSGREEHHSASGASIYHSETSGKRLADTPQPSDVPSLHWLDTSGREEHHSASGASIYHSETSGKRLADTPQPSDVPSLHWLETSGRDGHHSASGASIYHSETSGKKLADTPQPSDVPSLHWLETSGRDEHRSASGASILVQGKGPHATEALDMNFPQIHHATLGQNYEVQMASNISNRQVKAVTQGEVRPHNIISFSSDFPAPEKLLSLPHGLSGVPKDLGPESTPARKELATGDAGSNMLSGKKRSFNESPLTAQSLHLEESPGLFTRNATGAPVQDDTDLLSSILVGRRSSVFKMKSTPPLEVPSTKRRRSAPKTGISKRKVLMDDNMVLHGDTIRQQLTNTEDIRRLRKKAPCTRSEISMIEKQFWEDELFSEAIFTGVSIKMTYLHSHLYDLRQIVVSHCDVSLEGGTDQNSIARDGEKGMQLEMGNKDTSDLVGPNVPKENGGEDNFDPVTRNDVSEAPPTRKDVPEAQPTRKDVPEAQLTRKDVSEAQPIEFPLVADDHTCNKSPINVDDYGNQAQMHATGDVPDPFSSGPEFLGQGTAMEIDAKSFLDADNGVSAVPFEVESLARVDVVPGDTCDMSAAPGEVDRTGQVDASLQMDAPGEVDKTAQVDASPQMDALGEVDRTGQVDASPQMDAPGEVDRTGQVDASPQMDAPGFHSDEKMDLQSVNMDPYIDDINTNKSFGSGVTSEIKVDVASVREISEEPVIVANTSTTFSSETNGLRPHIDTLDEVVEIKKNEELVANKDAPLAPDAECNAQNLVCNGIFGEKIAMPAALDEEVNPVLEDVSLEEREISGHQVTFPAMNEEDIPTDDRVDDESTYSAVGNDTDFLNFDDVDDDDEVETADDYMPDAGATTIIDNSGWSSRTKAVAKYLHIMFDKEGAKGRNSLPVDNLLAGKTRKEASRMFFETLVLKTKDYIHVEQRDPYDNIDIFPRAKLLKSDF